MSEKNKLSLKRTRQSSSTNGEKRPRIAEEQISSSKATGAAAYLSEKPRVLKRAFFSEGKPKTSSKKKRLQFRNAWSESEKYSLEKESINKANLYLDPKLYDGFTDWPHNLPYNSVGKVQEWFDIKEQQTLCYSSISSNSSLFDSGRGEIDRAEFVKKISSDRHLANYDLGDVIGYGSFGQVVAATRKADSLPVALKFVSKETVRELKEINGMQVPAEAFLQNKAQHRHVVKIYEVLTTEEHYVYVMERPEMCKDLFDILQLKVTLSEKEARRYFFQIIEANINCEENGVIHRDLKPENILVDLHSDEAKLIDFGLASEVQEKPFVKFRGTNAYTPPEFFRTGKYDGCQGTVWQIGILLVETLSPVMAFDKPEQSLNMAPRLPEHLSPEVKNLISSLLNTVPAKRPTLTEVLQHPWFAMQD